MNEDAYYQLQLEQWGRFYSCCCQYREVSTVFSHCYLLHPPPPHTHMHSQAHHFLIYCSGAHRFLSLCSHEGQSVLFVHRQHHIQVVFRWDPDCKVCSHTASQPNCPKAHIAFWFCVLRCVHRLSQSNCPKVHIAFYFCVQVGTKLQCVFTDCHCQIVRKYTQHSVSVFRWEPSCKVCSQTASQALCASSAEQHSPTCGRVTSWNGSTSASRSG